MKKSLFLLMLTASLSAYAANHEIKMLDNGKDGSMVFEPGYVNAKVGDTVTFKATNSGHWVQSKALPEGVADFLSEDGKDFTLKLDKEGVYVYTCPPHRMMNMSGVILLGEGKVQAQGAPQDVLQADIIGRLYKVDIELLYCSKGLPVIRPMRKSA